MKDESEKRIFDKYIRPYTGILSRIKTKLLIRYRKRKRRIKTVDDVDFLSSSLVVKLFVILFMILMSVMAIRALVSLIYDVYVSFFPPIGGESSNNPYFIPVIRRMLENV